MMVPANKSLFLLIATAFRLVQSNIIYGGAILHIKEPKRGDIITGPFAPKLNLAFDDGPVAGAVRNDPTSAHVCIALDGELQYCEPILSDKESTIANIEASNDKGLGHNLHVLDYWVAMGSSDRLEAVTSNASVVFSSGPVASLHMPDSYEIYFADCMHTRESTNINLPGASEVRPLAKGILHIGANEAHESSTYGSCVGGGGSNVLFIECDKEVAKKCQANAKKFGQRCLQACLSNKNAEGVSFFQSSSNGGMSSSLREMDKHHDIFPGVEHSGASTVRVWRFDDLVASIPEGLLPELNIITIDAQGMEYEILQGMESYITSNLDIELLIVEVSHIQVYKGQKFGTDVDRLMMTYGFQCKEHCEPCDHCDRLYERKP